VQTRCVTGIAAVFNLTVEGEHEYFANGVLVSNCDAARYLCMYRPYDEIGEAQAPTKRLGWQPGFAMAAKDMRLPTAAGAPLGPMS